MVDFDKFFRLSLSEIIANHGEDSSVVVADSGAEECAIECANRVGQCQAFQVCRTDTSYEPTCTFLTKLVASKAAPNLDALLIGDDRCTSFLISPKSELNNFGNREELDGDEFSMDNVENSSTETSNWLIKLIIFLTGLSLGHLMIIIVRKRHCFLAH